MSLTELGTWRNPYDYRLFYQLGYDTGIVFRVPFAYDTCAAGVV